MAKLAEYFASISNGDIHSITYAFPAHELQESQIELTKEEYYLLKAVHGANGNVVELAGQMINNIKKKIHMPNVVIDTSMCTCNSYQLENYGCKCGAG